MKVVSTAGAWKRRLGILGEQLVATRLQEMGWEIDASNWRNGRKGEIDIIARNTQGIYVFLEVKTRCYPRVEAGFQTAGFDAITREKKKKIVTSARCYLAERDLLKSRYRFDVVVVTFVCDQYEIANFGDSELPNPVITHVQDAIGGF